MENNRKTKIIATIGPASKNALVLNQLIREGVDIFRFNLKYSTPSGHGRIIDRIRKITREQKKHAQILVDIPSFSFTEGVILALDKKADFIAVSHVRKPVDIKKVKQKIIKNQLLTKIIAKIETREALNCFDLVLDEADALMVARGDLGKTIPIEQVPFVQKEIVLACKDVGKIVIIATEMLLSMVSNNKPTRAEVSDVANAVLEGSDGVMLSEETTVGQNPVEAVKVMNKVICEAESWQRLGHLHIFSAKNKKFKFGE